jgi:hypothetical protein
MLRKNKKKLVLLSQYHLPKFKVLNYETICNVFSELSKNCNVLLLFQKDKNILNKNLKKIIIFFLKKKKEKKKVGPSDPKLPWVAFFFFFFSLKLTRVFFFFFCLFVGQNMYVAIS